MLECCEKKTKLPALSKANEIKFPLKPFELDLTNLEERLVAPRIPFMQLHKLPRGGQTSLTGNIVNIPTNVNNTVSILPLKADDAACIPLKLKRRMNLDRHFLYQNVRPNKVIDAVKWLVKESDLYKEEGIKINAKWQYEDMGNNEQQLSSNSSVSADTLNDPLRDEEWDETKEEDIPVGTLDTMFQSADLAEESRNIISVAPGEGSSPLSIFMDKQAETLSFPTIYCGEKQKDGKDHEVMVYYSDICKSELRRTDRRVAGHIPNLFFKVKKLQMKHILDKANLCLRKTKHKEDYTAGFLKHDDNIKSIIHFDDGYTIFKDLRGSPPYWEKVKSELLSMIRQLGIPTWFASFSSADTKWTHLLKILGLTVYKTTYTDEKLGKFDWMTTQTLIKKDPVTCARHFDYQLKRFLSSVLLNSSNPIGKVSDYFYKIEFQMRGSPHVHMLIWIEDAPTIENSIDDDYKDVTEFIDKYISCDESQEDMQQLLSRQRHFHSRTCKKTKKTVV